MGILMEYFLKAYYRIIGLLKVFIWKLLFLSKLKIGRNTYFYPTTSLMIEHTGNIQIGNNCFFNRGCSFTSKKLIKIGNDCIFGENVKIYDHNHLFKEKKNVIRKQGFSTGEVVIGNNVWVGTNSVILSNVTIGDNVVIAAGSVITKSIPDNVVVVQKRITSMEELL